MYLSAIYPFVTNKEVRIISIMATLLRKVRRKSKKKTKIITEDV